MTDQVYFTYNGHDTYGYPLGLTAAGDMRVLVAPVEQIRTAGRVPAVVVVPITAAYTSLQRSINAKKQLRDKKGRWIEMGGGIFKFMLGGKQVAGKVVGVDTKNSKVTVEINGVNHHVNPKAGEFVKTKATLTPSKSTGKSSAYGPKKDLPEDKHTGYEVGDLVEQPMGSSASRWVLVTKKLNDVKDGEAGYDGVVVDDNDKPTDLKAWGYSDSIKSTRPKLAQDEDEAKAGLPEPEAPKTIHDAGDSLLDDFVDATVQLVNVGKVSKDSKLKTTALLAEALAKTANKPEFQLNLGEVKDALDSGEIDTKKLTSAEVNALDDYYDVVTAIDAKFNNVESKTPAKAAAKAKAKAPAKVKAKVKADTLDEAGAVAYYADNGYAQLNTQLRASKGGPVEDESLQPYVDHLDAAIEKHSLKAQTVYRGVRVTKANMPNDGGPTWIDQLEVGSQLKDHGFVSASRSSDIANMFAGVSKGASITGQSAVVELDIPEGTPGIDVIDYAKANDFFDFQHDEEQEIILPRGTALEITDIEDKNSVRYIKAKLVTEDQDGKEADQGAGQTAPAGQDDLDGGPDSGDTAVKPDAGADSDAGDGDAGGDAEEVESAHAPDAGEMLKFDPETWSKKSGAQGSNAGGIYTAPDGDDYYIKFAQSNKHAQNEVLADNLYEALGIKTSKLQLLDLGDDKLGTASKIIPGGKTDLGSKLNDKEYLDKLGEGFAADVWLANWDVAGTGYDNVMTDAAGDPVRVDPGGALLFRAMGTPKGAAFGDKATEWDTLVDPSMNPYSAKVFGKLTDEQKSASAQKVAAVTDDQIDGAVDAIGFDAKTADELKSKLKSRRDDVAKRADLPSPAEPQAVTDPTETDVEVELEAPGTTDMWIKEAEPTGDTTDEALAPLQKALKDSDLVSAAVEAQNVYGMPPALVGLADSIEVLGDNLDDGKSPDSKAVADYLRVDLKEWNAKFKTLSDNLAPEQFTAAAAVSYAAAIVLPALDKYLGTDVPNAAELDDTDVDISLSDALTQAVDSSGLSEAIADFVYHADIPTGMVNSAKKLNNAIAKLDTFGDPNDVDAKSKTVHAFVTVAADFEDDWEGVSGDLDDDAQELGNAVVTAADDLSKELYEVLSTYKTSLEENLLPWAEFFEKGGTLKTAPSAQQPPTVADGVIGEFDGKKYVADADGNAMFEGDTVTSKKDGVTGVIKKIEGNGKYVKVQTPDGAVKGRRTNTLQVKSDKTPAAAESAEENVPAAPTATTDAQTPSTLLGDLMGMPVGTSIVLDVPNMTYEITKVNPNLWRREFDGDISFLDDSSVWLNLNDAKKDGVSITVSTPETSESSESAPAPPAPQSATAATHKSYDEIFDEDGHVFPPLGVPSKYTDSTGNYIFVGDDMYSNDEDEMVTVVGWTNDGLILAESQVNGGPVMQLMPDGLSSDPDTGTGMITYAGHATQNPAEGMWTWTFDANNLMLKVGDKVKASSDKGPIFGTVLGSTGDPSVVEVEFQLEATTALIKINTNALVIVDDTAPTPTPAPTVAETPSVDAPKLAPGVVGTDSAGKKYVSHPFSGKPIYVGTEVKHPSSGSTGVVKTLESNGKYVKVTVTEPDGSKKVKGLAISKLDVIGAGSPGGTTAEVKAKVEPEAPKPQPIEGAKTYDGAQVNVGDALVVKHWGSTAATPKFSSGTYIVQGPAENINSPGYVLVKTPWGHSKTIFVGNAIHTFPSTDAPKVPPGFVGTDANGKQYLSTHFGTPIYVGAQVKNTSNKEGVYTVKSFESNGKYVKVTFTDADGKTKTKGMAASKVYPIDGVVKLDESGYKATATPGTSATSSPTPAAPSTPSGEVYTGELSLPLNAGKNEKFVGASGAKYNEEGASLPGIVQPKKKVLDESDPLYGAPEPQLPAELQIAAQPFVDDEWVAKVKQRYLDNPNKAKSSLELSNSWNKVQNVITNGDTGALDNLFASKYVDDVLYKDAIYQITKAKSAKEAAKKANAGLEAEYAKTHKAWLEANTVTNVNPNGFADMPELSTTSVDPAAPDWSQAHVGTASLDSVLAKMKTDTKFAGRGLAVAVDSGAIEGVEVYTRYVRQDDGTLALELRTKLSPAHGDALAAEIAAKGIKPTGVELVYRVTEVGDDGVVTYSKLSKNKSSGATYDIDVSAQLGGDVGGKVTFERASLGKTKTNQHVRHNSFIMTLSPDATSADIGKVFERFGIEARPATDGDLKVLAENKLMAVMGAETDPLKNPTAESRAAALASIKAEYGVTADQVVVGYTSQGHLAFYLPDHARDKAIQKVGGSGLKGFQHNISGDGNVIADMITGARPGLLSTNQRWINGIGTDGMSSSQDTGTGGADFLFTKPKHSASAHSGRYLMIHPKAMMRRLDIYGNAGDAFGKHHAGTHVYDLVASETTYEIMAKHGVPIEDIWYIQVYTEQERQDTIKRAKSKGTYEVNGIPIEDFVVAPGGKIPEVDDSRWDVGAGTPAAP